MWKCQQYSYRGTKYNFPFDHENGNVEGHGQQQGLQWIVHKKAYLNVKCESVNSIPTMELNIIFHLTLKLGMLKVMVNNKGCKVFIKTYLHVKCERVIINSISTMELDEKLQLTLKPGMLKVRSTTRTQLKGASRTIYSERVIAT